MSDPIRLLHTEASIGMGGQERRILREFERLDPSRFNLMLACRPGSQIAETARKRGYAVREVEMRSSLDIGAIFRFRRLLKEERIDIVHTHSSRDAWLVGYATRWMRRPVVVRTRHIRNPIRGRLVYTWLTDHIVTVSEDVRRHLLERGISEKKVTAIPTGVDLQEFDRTKIHLDLRSEWGLRREDFLIGIVAVLRGKKGHRFLIEAVNRLADDFPNLHLVIVGEGPMAEEIDRQIAASKRPERFHRVGTRADIPATLAAFDLFVMPSTQEALGTSIIEAMAMRVPVVASNVGGIPELVQDRVTGLLTPPGDVEGVMKGIRRIIEDRTSTAAMVDRAYRSVAANYSVSRMIDQLQIFYERLAREKDRHVA